MPDLTPTRQPLSTIQECWKAGNLEDLSKHLEDDQECIKLEDYLTHLSDSKEWLNNRQFSIRALQLIVDRTNDSDKSNLIKIVKVFEEAFSNSQNSPEEIKLNAQLLANLYKQSLISNPFSLTAKAEKIYLEEWIKQGHFSLIEDAFTNYPKKSRGSKTRSCEC